MPPKARIPAPIDRPLSRAYLREFSGWSTAFPPGLSEPTSLRIMENTMVNRDGSLRIRPGLRYLSYASGLGLPANLTMVGTHEVFFLNNGDKAYLFAVRDSSASDLVKFKVARYVGGAEPFEVLSVTDPLVGFPGELFPFQPGTTYVKYLQIDNKILALSDAGEPLRLIWVGAEKKTKLIDSITQPAWTVLDKPLTRHPNQASVTDPVANPPLTNHTGGVRTALTLFPPVADASSVPYNVGYYYTFSNELGESAASQISTRKIRRRWTAWQWQTPNAAAEPSGTETDDPAAVADQIAIYPSNAAFLNATTHGATYLNVYAIMWSDQDAVPVEGTLIGTKELTPGLEYEDCWVRHSPAQFNQARTTPLPTEFNRTNFTSPPTAGQGIVAADRLVLVNDPAAGAVIRWTANQLGDYTNFTASAGGGYKTLTSGNLYIPACVKLWQNPQSADTLTILCRGVDGYGASYYMAPAQVASQSDAVNIMGFEETTATPGTTSPYGCEVLNNALYHPLETELVKSTASNYNINHKSMSDLIANMWKGLLDKDRIVSSQLDNRLYYIVHNRYGAELEEGCWGNEVWVVDTAAEGGSWSRWMVQAHSLRKIEVDGRIVMSVVRPEGLYCFDDSLATDDVVHPVSRAVSAQPIDWRIETNTQGANRAHDAWAHLQQVTLALGNFTGTMRFGVRGFDLHGKAVEVAKQTRDLNAVPADGLPFDIEDHLAVRRDMKEWRFFAESVTQDGAVLPSAGQINQVQYRYTPVSVNVGYEYGSVETFEYSRAAVNWAERTTDNGVPMPMTDVRRP